MISEKARLEAVNVSPAVPTGAKPAVVVPIPREFQLNLFIEASFVGSLPGFKDADDANVAQQTCGYLQRRST